MRIAIIGGGGYGRVIIDIVEKLNCFELLGIVDARIPVGESISGYEVLGRECVIPDLVEKRRLNGVVIAVGDNWVRSQVAKSVRELLPGIEFPNVIHPSAQIGKDVRMGCGNAVMAGAIVNSNASIGEFCILNTNCTVEHDCELGNFVSFAPNSCVGGNVRVGDFSAICLAANVIHGIRIGSHAVVGAGSTVLGDIPSNCVAFGTPARMIRPRGNGEKYM